MALVNYRNLDAWKKSMALVEAVYLASRGMPADEKFGLTSQLRRASVSIPANVAEGYARTHRGDYLHHLSIAKGSLAETETLLMLSVNLKMITREAAVPVWKLAQDVGMILTKLIRSLQPD